MKPETQYQLTTILLEENQTYSLSGKELPEGFEREDGIWEGEVIHMALDDCREPQPEDRYGRLKGIHRIWKEIKTPYICVNVGNALARVKQEDLESLRKGKIGMILPRIFCNGGLQEDYRGQYYVSDFRLMLSVLEKESPRCYKFVKEKQLGSAALLLFGGIFRKEEFDRICQWIFPILARCGRHIPAHFSLRQNRSLEQLSPYLFTFFVNFCTFC